MFTEMQPAPTYFYQSPRFTGRSEIVPDSLDGMDRVQVFAASEQRRERYREQIDARRVRRSGVLAGDYVVILDGMLALNRNGTPIMINAGPEDDWDNPPLSAKIGRYCRTPEFLTLRESILEAWDQLNFVSGGTVLTDVYLQNYYHYKLFFLPKIRMTQDTETTVLLMQETAIALPFQKEMLTRAAGERRMAFFKDIMPVRDPFLIQEPASFEGVQWVRETMGLAPRKGGRNIYIRRSPPGVSRARSIVEDEAFDAFLARHGFESVFFGEGDVSVADQTAMLDGANVILSMHGANLTNMLYLDTETTVIEVLPGYWSNYTHVHIGAAVGLHYRGVITEDYTPDGSVRVDIDRLEALMAEASSRA